MLKPIEKCTSHNKQSIYVYFSKPLSTLATERENGITCMAAKTPQGPPSCCTRPIDVSESELNLQQVYTSLANQEYKKRLLRPNSSGKRCALRENP